MNRTPGHIRTDFPDWPSGLIDGRRIIDRGMAEHTGANGKPLVYRVGVIEVEAPTRMVRPT